MYVEGVIGHCHPFLLQILSPLKFEYEASTIKISQIKCIFWPYQCSLHKT